MPEVEHFEAEAAPERIGIVHLGLGAFHRAHQAVYLQHCLEAGQREWGLCSVNLRANHALVTGLRAQQGRYHVAEYRDREHVTLREITAICEALFTGRGAGEVVPDDLSVLLERLEAPSTRIVTLTVTEKGYCLSPASGRLRFDDPTIAEDLETPEQPRSAPGLLVEGLRRRRAAGVVPFAVLSCDNMPSNGRRVRAAVIELAQRLDEQRGDDLADWIAREVAFPSSMVDRIVPAMDERAHRELAGLGVDDPAAVTCEVYSQWVIEDDFPAGRPDWAAFGVEMVADVTPFETMKLRMLNGSHSLLAYVGVMAGFETVSEAVADPAMAALIHGYMHDEAAPTLTLPVGVDPAAYAERLLVRFSNDSLHHRLQQIAMDGSQKLPQRWLHGARCQLAGERPRIAAVALGVAAWIRYTAGRDGRGELFEPSDPLVVTLQARHRQSTSLASLVTAMLGITEIFPVELADDARFYGAVLEALDRIDRYGMAAALQYHVEQEADASKSVEQGNRS
ncbi:mannitol dehydrogenase family protein [Kushneria phosphatilytica]|uniref:Mannitol dehydrogenase family protein n=1 Tax=Kushneria phosphatilytica TaxID=657387 RepID=A0A1S1NVD7_9GAMM|nr:mannitol dehydrogenase family protein [Kushneria phosphatilytica]OHV10538.1 mannitol dehydrogenase [Kushneria phosphatilytica]QEL11892.1 mannitol dehydrogenase family protein [Kushneria phosphatilytica]